MFEGLDSFIAEVLIYGRTTCCQTLLLLSRAYYASTGLRWIQRYNENGVQRMQRNIFALQQYFAGYVYRERC